MDRNTLVAFFLIALVLIFTPKYMEIVSPPSPGGFPVDSISGDKNRSYKTFSPSHTEKKITKIIENIKSGYEPSKDLFRSKYKFYDAIFLDVLARRNEKGEQIFSKFYQKNSVEAIFVYLDEETTFTEDLKIMFSLFDPEFIVSFFRKFRL